MGLRRWFGVRMAVAVAGVLWVLPLPLRGAAAKTAQITATAGAGGTTNPAGVVKVAVPSSTTFSIRPDSGYAIASVVVDGANKGAIASYTFVVKNTQAHTLKATFRSLSPTVPTGLSARALGASEMSVDWVAVVGATAYDLQVDGALVTGVSKPYIHQGLAPGSSHTYQVRACNGYGASAWSPQITQLTSTVRKLDAYVYSDLAQDLVARAAFFSFAQAKGIGRIYLEAGGLVQTAPAALADFIAAAQVNGIAVSLLTGDATWSLSGHHGEALTVANAAASFAAELKVAGKPAPEAIQFDVEPYLLPSWDTDLQGTANQYLDLLAELHGALQGKLALTVAIPFWFDLYEVTRAGQKRPLSEWVIDATDGTVMMDYRDTAAQIVDLATTELVYASQQGRPLTVAVDLQCGSSEPTYITFCEEGETAMRSELAAAQPALEAYQAFAGYAIFYYEAWAALPAPALAPSTLNALHPRALQRHGQAKGPTSK